MSLSNDEKADMIEAFYSTSRYLDDPLSIDTPYFKSMVSKIAVESNMLQIPKSPFGFSSMSSGLFPLNL